jgi:hypothetical protein
MSNLEKSIELAKEYLGFEYFFGLKLNYKQVEQKSVLIVNKEKNVVDIEYGEVASLFFALTLIKQNHKKESFAISLTRHFDSNGLMHDCSRNGPLNIKQAKQMIMVLALFGLNRFMLYTEDVYEMDGEPFFGYLRGRYTKAELKELNDYALGFGVELVPCIQTLSHLYQALKWGIYDPVRDTWNTLLVNEPKTYELIDKMLATCEEVFTTRNIHIGMDEAFDICSGPFIWKNKVLDKKEMFLTHLNKVVELCKKHNFKPMMWCDMFFKLECRKSEEYLDWYAFKGYLSEETKSLIPDVGLVYWDYYHKEHEIYDNLFEACLDTKKVVLFADGSLTWSGFAPNIIQSMENSRCGLESAVKKHIKNVFITSWGDNGNECSAVACYPTIALHSMFEFYGGGNAAKLSKLLETVTGDSLKLWSVLQEPNHLRNEQIAFENLSRVFFYQDILLGVADGKVKLEYSDKYIEIAKQLKTASRKSKKYGYVYKSLQLLSDFLINKSTIGVRLRKAYKDKNTAVLRELLEEIKTCEKKLNKFLEVYRIQWDIENKPFGFDILDGRMGFLNNRIKTAYNRLKDYLDGRLESIPELEQEILPWHDSTADDPTYIGNWTELASINAY